MREVFIVAGKEFRDGMRNRWILAITLAFALLAMGLAWFGAAASGGVGFTRISTTIVSLASLAVFLIPLIALMLAYDSIVGEEEKGTLLLLMTYPLSRTGLLAGKFLGHGAILALSTLLGFGIAAVLIVTLAEQATFANLSGPFSLFILSAILLGLVFLALAYLVSVLTRDKARAAGLALLTWFMFVLVYDLTLLGVLVGTQGRLDGDVFRVLLLLNPTDVFRLVNLIGFEETAASSGLLSVFQDQDYPLPLLLGILVAWILVPLAAAAALFSARRT
ncbi:ABC-type transport system involved in multi-copper enzyme maturation, permease component [Thioalkalivibrio sulfidiphilus HL-EbGr7]|uniref:ABC-type transport system involved in multi-copper enzyme maturation, permease component n=1 Tax=Thioalkalivibrio sulfidiphilus (strain HL-EbGR7) TaxID=396588 RepID=B8GM56_THISH|nr:ABC transporter permease subunit [Thioalkalivibrio sulfidiphilus]ACL73643.1 ABC-type transport system involved in multi-copper enzyme maturation, permease component [Thioalkalivibrio sulfidiphilus HL-EbGr7]